MKTSPKTPTSLLLDDKNNVSASGFDAEELYQEYVEDERHETFRFFKNFKLNLHREKVFMPIFSLSILSLLRSLE